MKEATRNKWRSIRRDHMRRDQASIFLATSRLKIDNIIFSLEWETERASLKIRNPPENQHAQISRGSRSRVRATEIIRRPAYVSIILTLIVNRARESITSLYQEPLLYATTRALLFAGKLHRDVSSTKLSRGAKKKKSRPTSLASRVRSTRHPVFAQHRFPPIETSSLASYFPRIASNVFAKIGLPLISLPPHSLSPLPHSPYLLYHCDLQIKTTLVVIDHAAAFAKHFVSTRR